MRERGFDEVMIVNPQERAGQARGVRLMPYYDANYPEMGGYADPVGQEPWSGYGEEYQVADAGEPEYGYCDGLDEAGEYADPGYAYADADPNFLGQEPVGYVAQEPYAQPMGYGYVAAPGFGACTGQEPCPRCSGLSDAELFGPAYGAYAQEDPRFSGYADDPILSGYSEDPAVSGYTTDLPSRFNASFGIPGSVAGVDEAPLDGFVRPREVGPVVRDFTPAPESPNFVPETFKPLW